MHNHLKLASWRGKNKQKTRPNCLHNHSVFSAKKALAAQMLSATRKVTMARTHIAFCAAADRAVPSSPRKVALLGLRGTDSPGPNQDGWKETWHFYSEFPGVTPLWSTTKAGNKAGSRGQSGASTHAAAGRPAEGRGGRQAEDGCHGDEPASEAAERTLCFEASWRVVQFLRCF